MKKSIAIVAAAFFVMVFSANVTAQQFHDQVHEAPVRIGLKGGYNLANLVNTDISEPGLRSGVVLGAGMKFNFGRSAFGMESGVLYAPKGTQFQADVENVGENINHSIELNYLVVPALVTYSLDTALPVFPQFVFGPYLGFLNSANYELSDQQNDFRSVVDISDNVNSVDYGLKVGVGVEMYVGQTAFDVQARYSLGLNSIYDQEIEGFEQAEDLNSVFTVMVGLWF